MDKTVLVFGANGNLGSHFVNQALEAGCKIKAFLYSAKSYEHANNPNVEVVQGDATNYDDVEKGKPHPDMLHKVLDELGHGSDEALFIGDGPRDEMAAKEASMDYIMVDWGFTDHNDAVRTVEDLKEILLNV